MSTYTDADHAAAVARIDHAQTKRDVGEPDARAVESMAPENTGRPRHRAQSIEARVLMAAQADRSVVRRRLLRDGEIRDRRELLQAMGQHSPNRAERRARRRGR